MKKINLYKKYLQFERCEIKIQVPLVGGTWDQATTPDSFTLPIQGLINRNTFRSNFPQPIKRLISKQKTVN